MKNFIGVKRVKAKPMNRLEYNQYRGWELPADENGADEGMLVEYIDGGASNHPNHKGYISWSPIDVFNNAYKEVTGLTFGFALEAVKEGKLIAREGWNGKGMFVFQRPADKLSVEFIPKVKSLPESVKERLTKDAIPTAEIPFTAYLCMYAADGSIVNGWLASQTDMLAEDWEIL